MHGFPSSSYDYHRALEHLTKEFTVVIFDHPGFGFSDKPNKVSGKHLVVVSLTNMFGYLETYTYSPISLHYTDQAEITLGLLSTVNITSAQVVAHDVREKSQAGLARSFQQLL